MDECIIKIEPEIKQGYETCSGQSRIKNENEFKIITPYIDTTIKYSDIIKMTYADVTEMMEKMLAFCELKHEISLEEFLILRRTRDQMHLRSIAEKKAMNEQ